MNSYMRRTPITADQMHSFLKDKQAWENAIAMYQGPDPLDHWYNYVCWYENNSHGDPENKFRETLERCLTLYEHSEYYKQDPRMVRLWVKYIDMQPNPLHFYQILYQRGLGRQCACFYINWARYYESINALKEAESVFNLAFQEKAQPFLELQNAHSKLLYVVRTAAAATLVVHEEKHQQELTQQHMLQQQQAKLQQQLHYQQQQQQMQLQQVQQVHIHHPQHPHQPQPQQIHHQIPHQHTQPHPPHPHQQEIYQHVSYQRIPQQPQLQPQQLQQAPLEPQLQYQQVNEPQQELPVHYHQHQVQQLEEKQYAAEELHHGSATNVTPTANYASYAEDLSAASAATLEPANLQEQADQFASHSPASQTDTCDMNAAPVPQETPIEGIRLPRKFASYCRNNYEVWKPALFLEEPEDPNRRCHYNKELVYPGNNIEYSPEEIRAHKWKRKVRELKHQLQKTAAAAAAAEEEAEAGNTEQLQSPKSQHISQQQLYQQYQLYQQQQFQEQQQVQPQYAASEKDDEDEEERDDDGDDDDDDADATYDEDEDKESEEEEQQQHVASNVRTGATIVHTMDDLEDQIEASTIRFSTHTAQGVTKNKTIKIKFKKECKRDDTLNGSSNYSSYTIDSSSSYQQVQQQQQQQQELSSPATAHHVLTPRSNGNSFHPYNIGQTSTPKTSNKRSKTKLKIVNKFHAVQAACNNSNSSSADFLGGGTTTTTTNGRTAIGSEATTRNAAQENAITNASFNDNANFSFSSAAALDNSNCSVTSGVGRLNFRDTTATNAVADFSTYNENSYFATQHDAEAKELRLKKAIEAIERHLSKEAVDPFNSELCRSFLTKLNFPGTEDSNANYKIIQTPLPKMPNTKTITLPDGVQFNIDKEVGRGSYGSVYKATDANTGAVVALKYQKPPNTWEIYICDQVLQRIKSSHVLPGLMDISTAVIAPNASIIATEFSPFGSLLDINNKIRQATTKVMHESLVMHFSSQICNIIHHLHKHKIIHADIKPDNFLLMRVPSTDLYYPSLRLIDFGCAIDMTLFPDPENTKFRKVIQTDGFTCVEMQEGRPWSYETDLFCIAGTVHVMLFGEYMQLQKRAGIWDIKQKLPRYLKKHVWTKFFGSMLNIKSTELPDLNEMRAVFDEEAAKMDSELQSQIRTLSNILYRR